jgi:hypothetical protein
MRPRAVELFDQHDADQRMRQREPRQRPLSCGPRATRLGESSGAADQERDAVAIVMPAAQAGCEILTAPRFTVHLECDRLLVRMQRRQQCITLFVDCTCARASRQRQLAQFDSVLARQALAVFGKPLLHPVGHARADCEDAQACRHQRGSASSDQSLSSA